MKNKDLIECKSIQTGPSELKYKGRWGVLKPGRSLFIGYEAVNLLYYIDLKLGKEPEAMQIMAEWLAQAKGLDLLEEISDSYVLVLRNDNAARAAVRHFRKDILPILKTSEYAELFDKENYYCGQLREKEAEDGNTDNPWDDSSVLARQFIALDDGRVIVSSYWSEYREYFIDYDVPKDELGEMDQDALIDYLESQGLPIKEIMKDKQADFMDKGHCYRIQLTM